MKQLVIAAFLIASILALSGCGQYGKLYLPDKAHADTTS